MTKNEVIEYSNKDVRDIYKELCYHRYPYDVLNILEYFADMYRAKSLLAKCDNIRRFYTIKNTCSIGWHLIDKELFTTYAAHCSVKLELPFTIPCCREHRNEIIKNDALFWQNIDANCNDCKYFVRGKMKGIFSDINKETIGGLYTTKAGTKVVFDGRCTKFNVGTFADPKTCTDYKCFENRKNN